jgi:hypothetical protein
MGEIVLRKRKDKRGKGLMRKSARKANGKVSVQGKEENEATRGFFQNSTLTLPTQMSLGLWDLMRRCNDIRIAQEQTKISVCLKFQFLSLFRFLSSINNIL